MNFFSQLLDAQWHIGSQVVLVREVVGNLFGLASALGGMRRKVWAWPVGIVGNVLLFTVFLGTVFHTPQQIDLWGQAGRQVIFIAVSGFGWVRWRRTKREGGSDGAAVVPQWASWRTRIWLVVALVAGTAALTPLFVWLGTYPPVWAEAWIFVGSALATFGMAKGWVEFWLIWVAVDLVGVPVLIHAHFYATSAMYVFYGAFTIAGFFVWRRTQRQQQAMARAAASSLPR